MNYSVALISPTLCSLRQNIIQRSSIGWRHFLALFSRLRPSRPHSMRGIIETCFESSPVCTIMSASVVMERSDFDYLQTHSFGTSCGRNLLVRPALYGPNLSHNLKSMITA